MTPEAKPSSRWPGGRPSKIVCVGRNYRAHAEELGNAMPVEPMLFLKPPSAIIGPGETILLPPESNRVEYEAEIGIVIGKRLRNVSPERACEDLAGYVCANDVTARDLQKRDGQWGRAKGFDTFCPVSPGPVASASWSTLEVRCRVNGVERQRGKATDMHFSIPDLLAVISRIMTLEPGDLILTGTPAGTGPLAPGDLVEVEIPGVSLLRNPVEAERR